MESKASSAGVAELPVGDLGVLEDDVEGGGAGGNGCIANRAGQASVNVGVGRGDEVAQVGDGETDLLGDFTVDGLLEGFAGV